MTQGFVTKKEHMAICVGETTHGIPLLAHAATGDNVSQVIVSRMRANCGYFVHAFTDTYLAQQVALVASIWATKNKIPYSNDRRQQTLSFLKEAGTLEQACEASREIHVSDGRWRNLKFWYRDDKPISPNSKKGFHCAQFASLCISMALLNKCQRDNALHKHKLPKVLKQAGLRRNNDFDKLSIAHADPAFILQNTQRQFWTLYLASNGKDQFHTGALPLAVALPKEDCTRQLMEEALDKLPVNAKLSSPSILIKVLNNAGSDGCGGTMQVINTAQHNPNSDLPHIQGERINLETTPNSANVITWQVDNKTFKATLNNNPLKLNFGDPFYASIVRSLVNVPPTIMPDTYVLPVNIQIYSKIGKLLNNLLINLTPSERTQQTQQLYRLFLQAGLAGTAERNQPTRARLT